MRDGGIASPPSLSSGVIHLIRLTPFGTFPSRGRLSELCFYSAFPFGEGGPLAVDEVALSSHIKAKRRQSLLQSAALTVSSSEEAKNGAFAYSLYFKTAPYSEDYRFCVKLDECGNEQQREEAPL